MIPCLKNKTALLLAWVLGCLLLLPSPLLNGAAEEKRIEVVLTPEADAKLQAYFQRIYDRIRIEEDPEQMPQIVLFRGDGSIAAYINPEEKGKIYIEIDHLLAATNEDSIAGTLAHELTHFQMGQYRRRASMGEGARLLNELEAQTLGILKRICRYGLVDPKTGEPQAAAYSLQAILREYQNDPTYRNNYGNYQNLAAGLEVFLARDWYLRKYPEETPLKKELHFLKPFLRLKRWWSGWGWKREKEPAPSAARKEMGQIFELYGKTPLERFRILHKRLEEAKGDPTKQAEIYDQFDSLFYFMREEKTEDVVSLFKQIPSGFFLKRQEFAKGRKSWLQSHEAEAEVDITFKILRTNPDASAQNPNQQWALFQASNWHLYDQNLGQYPEAVYLIQQIVEHRDLLLKMKTPPNPSLAVVRIFSMINQYQDTYFDPALAARSNDVLANLNPNALPEILKNHALSSKVTEQVFKTLAPDKILAIEPHLETNFRQALLAVRPELKPTVAQALSKRGDYGELAIAIQAGLDLPKATIDNLLSEALKAQTPSDEEGLYPYNSGEILDGLKRSPMAYARMMPYLRELDGKRTPRALYEGVRMSLDDQSVAHPGYSPLREKRDSFKNFCSGLLSGNSPDQWQTFSQSYPKSAESALDLISRAPLFYLGAVALESTTTLLPKPQIIGLPLEAILRRLSSQSFLSVLAMGNEIKVVTYNKRLEDFKELADASVQKKQYYIENIVKEFLRRIDAKEYNTNEMLMGLRLLSHMPGVGASTELRRLAEALHSQVVSANNEQFTQEYLSALPPALFQTPSDYVEHVRRLLSKQTASLREAELVDPQRQEKTKAFVSQVENVLYHVDPALKQMLLNVLAEDAMASHADKPIYTIDLKKNEKTAAKGAEYTNALLESYQQLPIDDRWAFLQWVRGKNPKLSKEVASLVRYAMANHGIFIPASQLEDYVRRRFDTMGPFAKAAFFQVCLNGDGDLLKKPGYVRKIQNEILSNLTPDLRRTVLELFDAAAKTLPPFYRSVILSTAFAESGHEGSPEEALRLILQRMGALVQKFGQNLAFDSNLPLSYRQELQKLWDDGENPGWWKVHELIKNQWGDIEAAGFRLVKIRNVGSTEITLELESRQGERLITSVQKEAVAHAAGLDAKYLREFIRLLTRTRSGRRRFGFLSILVEDGIRTIAPELDPTHKSTISPLMRKSYLRAALKLGGQYTEGELHLNGWKLETPQFTKHPLANGKELITQSLAPGVPLKSLQTTDPALYRELSEMLLHLENEAQAHADYPVDKDRMPGQFLVEPSSKTVTLLDHGQAKMLGAQIFAVRDPFVGAALTGNGKRIAELLESLGTVLTPAEVTRLNAEVAGVEPPSRPLHVLSWLFQNRKPASAETEMLFWDLVHAVRAKARLAHWGESLGVQQVADEWRASAAQELTPFQSRALQIKAGCFEIWGRIFRGRGKTR